MKVQFQPGELVQLRSSSPILTVVSDGIPGVHVVYFNEVTGLFERATFAQECLRPATTRPQVPDDAAHLRSTSVTKSSLS
jgi:hypothetical protein